MTHQGDDCYFYFYSTCAKGDNCLFRHCEAALGSETICTLWQEGRCFRQVCKFRHMEIDKRRSEIPCYWEKQLTGCTKLNCAFRHSRPRFIEGVFIPATKGGQIKQEVTEAAEEPMVPQSPVNQLQQPKIPIQSNPSPQVRGVMKLEASENVPSPTHPPVVINAADDDEDDDDQLSEEGEENKNTQPPTAEEQNGVRIISTKKQAFPVQKDDSLDFGIKTLEQIKRKKSMKEKLKKMDEPQPLIDLVTQAQKMEQNRENLVIEKENVRTVFRTVTLSPKKLTINEGELPFQRSLAERLGKKKMLPKDTPEEVPLTAEIEAALKRNLSERLGKRKLLAEDGPEELAQKVQAPRSIRERLGLPAEVSTTENAKGRRAAPDERGTKPKPLEQVRVKTLEEIRREKALRRQENQESLATQQQSEKPKNEAPPTRKRLLRLAKPTEAVKPEKANGEPAEVESLDTAAQEETKETNKPANGKEAPRSQTVQVKSFEEILKDKRLRQLQETEKQPSQTLLGEEVTANKMNWEIQAAEQSKQPAASAELRPDNPLVAEQLAVKTEEKLAVAKPEAAEPPLSLKVKPKLNVKPSVVKNSCPVRLSQKRKSPDSHPSTIMAVKPLNTVTTDLTKQPPAKKIVTSTPSPVQREEVVTSLPLQVPERSNERINLAEQSKPTSMPPTSMPPTSMPQTEKESFSPPQLPAKARRLSSTTTKLGVAEDDFEELMKEFSDEKLEAEIDLDPGKDEDDLLLELSEMIDS